MSYPDELCQLVISNMEIIEEVPKVVDHVETRLFTAINEGIRQRVRRQGNWKGRYDLCPGEEDQETSFAPPEWPEGEEGNLLACYTLWYMEAGEDIYWLSNAIGIYNSALRLQFTLKRDFTGLGTKEHKKSLYDFYNKNAKLAATGFHIAKDGTIYIHFTLETSKLVEEYPDFDEVLEPLDKALDTLCKEYLIFGGFINHFSQ